MELRKETTHVVIVFHGNHPLSQKEEVDLVPASWLKLVKSQWMCQYPPAKYYSKRTSWIKNSVQPSPEWPTWRVMIVKEAKNYDEGIRRRQRSYVNSNVESTSATDEPNDEQSNKDQQQPQVLDKNQKDLELTHAPPIEETLPERAAGQSEGNNVDVPGSATSTSTDYSSGADEIDRTLIHYTPPPQPTKKKRESYTRTHSANIREFDKLLNERGPSSRLRKLGKSHPPRIDANTSLDEQRPSPPTKRRHSQPSVVGAGTSSDEQRPCPPKKHRKTQPPLVVASTSSDEDQSPSPPRKRRKTQPPVNCVPTSFIERIPHLPKERNSTQPPIVVEGTSSDEDQRPFSPEERRNSQHLIGVTPQANNGQPQRDNVFLENIKSLIQRLMEKSAKQILKGIDSARRSVLYDLDKKVKEIKNTLILNSTKSGMNIVENRQILDIELPVRDPEVFSAFDMALSTAPDKEKAFKCVMASTILGITAGNKAVVNILKSILGKPVQEVYSGSGRQMRGNEKKNFSKTNTYLFMRDVVCESGDIAHDITHDQILTVTSRWLSGCGDREGGRVRQVAPVRQAAPIRQVTTVVQGAPIVPSAEVVQAQLPEVLVQQDPQ